MSRQCPLMTQSGHECFAETFHHESNPDLDFCFRDQGKDLELCRNIACSSPRFHSPPPFPAPRRRFGERVSLFRPRRVQNSHKQLTFVEQWRCCLELTGFPSRRILSRHATRNAAALAMNDSRHGTAQPGLIFGIELREFFFADVFDVLFHVFWVRWPSGIGPR